MKSPLYSTLAAALASTALIALPAFAQNNQGSGQGGGQSGADIQVQQPAPEITVQQPAPDITVQQPAPDVTVTQPKPQVTIEQPEPTVTVDQPKPDVTVQQPGEPNVTVQQPGQPNVTVQEPGQADVQGQQQTGTTATAVETDVMSDNPLYGMRGSEIVGQNVYGANGEEIGEVDNVVVSREAGQSPAVVVGVGGFLGIGERNVAIPLDQLRMEQDRLVTDMTRDQISGMQAYDQNNWDSWDADRPINEATNR